MNDRSAVTLFFSEVAVFLHNFAVVLIKLLGLALCAGPLCMAMVEHQLYGTSNNNWIPFTFLGMIMGIPILICPCNKATMCEKCKRYVVINKVHPITPHLCSHCQKNN